MKIAIVCGGGIVSGKEIMCLELGVALKEVGCEIELLTSSWGSPDFVDKAKAASIDVRQFRLGYISATLRADTVKMTLEQVRHWPGLLKNYRRYLRDANPDRVIHTNWHHMLLLWPLLEPRRDVCWMHEVLTQKQQQWFWSRLPRRIGKFVAVSDSTRQGLINSGIPDSKITVVLNAMSDPAAQTTSNKREQRPTVGIVGQIGAWKGHEDLLNALPGVRAKIPDVQLRVFGKGEPSYEDFLCERAHQLGISENVVWCGFVRDRAQIYREISILIVPSRCVESFGLTALEAAFFSIPVIASDLGGLAEVVEDGTTGFLVAPASSQELSDRITLLLQNHDLRAEMGRNARHRALRLFTRQRFVREFARVLRFQAA